MFVFITSLLNLAFGSRRSRPGRTRWQAPKKQSVGCKLHLESLEDRLCPSVVLLVSDNNHSSVERYDGTTGQFIDTFATPGSGGLIAPRGLGYGPDGNLYVSSLVTDNVLRYDGTTGQFLDNFASGGDLRGPHGLVFGPDGNLYVCSIDSNAVLRYDGMTGQFIDDFASGGGLRVPHDLAFGPDGNLYVTSIGTNSVERYNGTTGQFIDDFVPPNSGGLFAPRGLAFGPDGNLYVGEQVGQQRILRYDGQTGDFLGVFVPTGSGGLSQPIGLAFGPDANLYVSSLATDQILRYDGTTGDFINVFASGGGLSGPTVMQFHDTGYRPSPHGSSSVRFVSASITMPGPFAQGSEHASRIDLNAADWGAGGAGIPSKTRLPALHRTAHGQTHLDPLFAEFIPPQAQATLRSCLVSGDQPAAAVQRAVPKIALGQPSQAEAIFTPLSMITARHTQNAIFEEWGEPLLNVLARDVWT
jgi:streptogramin lyase